MEVFIEEDTVESSAASSSSRQKSDDASEPKNNRGRVKKAAKNGNNGSSTSSSLAGTTQTLSQQNSSQSTNSNIRTWTCQMCKKQFEQRVELNKHQCVELHLKLLKKKKDMRKKKWREAHWKKKIDLSYIETTNLTQLSQNIADNLAFCIDGTQEDLRACSKEVKDYLGTELGGETAVQMFLKCCMPEMYERMMNAGGGLSDANVLRKANAYFADGVYAESTAQGKRGSQPSSVSCRSCRAKFTKLADLVQHQRVNHRLGIKTACDRYETNREAPALPENAPIGFLSCDPFSYFLNVHWDSTVQKKCPACDKLFPRPKFRKHVLTCQAKLTNKPSNPPSKRDSPEAAWKS